jgi:hypothetical protein
MPWPLCSEAVAVTVSTLVMMLLGASTMSKVFLVSGWSTQPSWV